MEMEMEKAMKKLKNIIKGVMYLLKKKISNSKLFLDLTNLLLKRTHKLISKLHPQNDAVSDYEFTCSNTPAAAKRAASAIKEVLDMVNGGGIALESPVLPGFGRSPAAGRQLRITDSPFPVKENEEEAVREVNIAADEFIKRFYRELRNQKSSALDSPYNDFY
ncbi:hypothetical protein V2J09_002894 [Rumex salicifolius]